MDTRLLYMVDGSEWWGRVAGVCDSPLSHHAAGDSSITLRGATSIINKESPVERMMDSSTNKLR